MTDQRRKIRLPFGHMISCVEKANGPLSPFVRQINGLGKLRAELKWAKAQGGTVVDFLVNSPEQLKVDRVNAMLDEYGLVCGAIGSGGLATLGLFFTHPNPDNRRQAILACAELILRGAQIRSETGIGVPVIIGSMQGKHYCRGVEMTPATDKWPAERWPEKAQAHQHLREALTTLGPIAKNLGVPLIYEVLNMSESNLGTLQELDALVHSLGISSIKFLIDSFHFLCEGWTRSDIINLRTGIGYAHIVGLDRKHIGHADDSPRIVEFAEALSSYNGPIVAECMPWPDAVTAMARTREWLEEHFAA